MTGNACKVLVVEDDPAVRNLVSTALGSRGYRHAEVATGTAALAALTADAPDVLLLDLGLPDMDGVAIIRRLRTWSEMPIIVLSARSDDADKVEALDAGADDYLTKPFSVNELLARVRTAQRHLAHIAAFGQPASSVFVNGELSIDYVAGVVTLSGQELHLTPIEYKLLCLLARNVDKVLTHQFILREVWGTSHDGDLASLRVFMGTLRKKIEADPSMPRFIQTRVGVGYRMVRV